jgi:hypothetical protein
MFSISLGCEILKLAHIASGNLRSHRRKWLRAANEKNSVSASLPELRALERLHRSDECVTDAPSVPAISVPVTPPIFYGLQNIVIPVPTEFQAFTPITPVPAVDAQDPVGCHRDWEYSDDLFQVPVDYHHNTGYIPREQNAFELTFTASAHKNLRTDQIDAPFQPTFEVQGNMYYKQHTQTPAANRSFDRQDGSGSGSNSSSHVPYVPSSTSRRPAEFIIDGHEGKRARQTCMKCGEVECKGCSRRTLCMKPCQDCHSTTCEGRNSSYPHLNCEDGRTRAKKKTTHH